MKKILRWIAVVTVAVVVVGSAFLYAAVTTRKQSVIGRPPLTLQQIDEVAEKLDTRPVSLTAGTGTSTATSSGTDVGRLPQQLERAPSPGELSAQFPKLISEGEAEWQKTFEGLLRVVRAEKGFTWQAGELLMRAGKWAEARSYFYQALEDSSSRFTASKVAASLAWLEDDPEKAARLLEISVNEERASARISRYERNGEEKLAEFLAKTVHERLSNAVDLCQITGSQALASHYLERLHAWDAEMGVGPSGRSEEEER